MLPNPTVWIPLTSVSNTFRTKDSLLPSRPSLYYPLTGIHGNIYCAEWEIITLIRQILRSLAEEEGREKQGGEMRVVGRREEGGTGEDERRGGRRNSKRVRAKECAVKRIKSFIAVNCQTLRYSALYSYLQGSFCSTWFVYIRCCARLL